MLGSLQLEITRNGYLVTATGVLSPGEAMVRMVAKTPTELEEIVHDFVASAVKAAPPTPDEYQERVQRLAQEVIAAVDSLPRSPRVAGWREKAAPALQELREVVGVG